jgi:hypothetical protein
MTKLQPPREPSPQECDGRSAIGDGWHALWFPNIGGYVGRAAAKFDEDGCCDVFVWHDGQFPFSSDGDRDWDGRAKSPALLHISDIDDFKHFVLNLEEIESAGEE